MVLKKILMVVYEYPPIANVSIFRILSFAKYLPRFGFEPIILTVKNPDPLIAPINPNFSSQRIGKIKVYRTISIPLGWITRGMNRLGLNHKWIVIPDHYVGWIPHSLYASKKIIEKEKIDAIFATCFPASSLLIATLAAKSEIPLIFDYRDRWVGNPFTIYPTKFHQNLEWKMEAWVLKRAKAIITISRHHKEGLLKTYPFLQEERIHVITNGYDPNDFVDVKPKRLKNDGFTILHAGSIYGGIIKDFEVFLEAFQKVIEEDLRKNLQLVLAGKLAREARSLIRRFGMGEKIHWLNLIPHKEAIQLILGADLLLLIPGSPTLLPTKIFDYLMSDAPILNISETWGDAAQIIAETESGLTVKSDIHLIKETLKEIITSKKKYQRNKEVLRKYSRIYLTEKLASILHSII